MEDLLLLGIGAVAVLVWLLWFNQKRYLSQVTPQIENLRQGINLIQQQLTGMVRREEVEGLRSSSQQEMSRLRSELRQTLDNSSQAIGQRLDSQTKLVGDVRTQLGQLEEGSKRIYELGKDMASLQELLRSPKMRGGLGEYFLEELLNQVLPKGSFFIQHKFRTGERVDAAVRVGERLVPIDAKFPLDNFKKYISAESPEEKKSFRREFLKNVKERINEISRRYILPDEGTYDFALMYIPAENIYYELIVRDGEKDANKSLYHYALQRRVIPVSPSLVYAYLQVIVLGLKGLQIERQAEEILRGLGRLRGDLGKFQKDFGILGDHLRNARSKYEDAHKRLERFGEKLHRIDVPEREVLSLTEEER